MTIETKDLFDWQLLQPNPLGQLVTVAPHRILDPEMRSFLAGKIYDSSGTEISFRSTQLIGASFRGNPPVVVTQNIHGKQTHFRLGAINVEYQKKYGEQYPDCTAAIVENLPDWESPAPAPDDPSP